jgi:DNA-binding MarR family transcriptional regulator
MSRTSTAALCHDFILGLSDLMEDPTLPSQQMLLLTALYIHGDVNQSQLEELTGVKRSSNSRNISKLGRGEHAWSNDGPMLVESYEDEGNRRMKRVRLTPKGRALMEAALDRAGGKEVRGVKGASTSPVRA